MKKLILSLIFILFAAPVFSATDNPTKSDTPKFPKGKGAILLDELKEGKIYGSLEKMVDKNKAKTMRLVGHSSFDSPKDKMLAGNKFVLIGWLGVQKINDVSKVVMFKEPIVSSFIVQNDSDASGVPLPTFGEREYLEQAIKDLEEDKIDPEDFKKPRVIKIPSGKGTEIVLPIKRHKKGKSPLTGNKISEGIEGAANSEFKGDSSEEADLSYSRSSKDSKQNQSNSSTQNRGALTPLGGSSAGHNNGIPAFENQSRGNQVGQNNRINTPVGQEGQINNGSNSFENQDRRNQVGQNNRINTPVRPERQINNGSNSLNEVNVRENTNQSLPPSVTRFPRDREFDLHLLPRIDENNLPNIPGDAVVLVQNPNGHHEAYFVRDGEFARNEEGVLIHREVDVNVDGLPIAQDSRIEIPQNGNLENNPENVARSILYGRVERNEENRERVEGIIDAVFSEYRNSEQGQREPVDFGPEITIELTEEGCPPEHDALQERVTIMSRAKKFENGRLVDEGICEKTLENYNVKRDYLCEECIDQLNPEGKLAYARYREYWFDKAGKRNDLGIKIDEGVPFKFFEEYKGCPFNIEAEEGYAIRTSRIGYLNKFGVFKTVQDCSIPQQAEKFKIKETSQGCTQLMIEGTRHLQTKLVIHEEDKVTEIRECKPSGIELIPDKTMCANHYIHDFQNHKTYVTAQYYYEGEHGKQSVTDCQKTGEVLNHQYKQSSEWAHNDAEHYSTPKYFVYIEDEGKEIRISEPVVVDVCDLRYHLPKYEQEATGILYMPYRDNTGRIDDKEKQVITSKSIIKYVRPDNSTYSHNLGFGISRVDGEVADYEPINGRDYREQAPDYFKIVDIEERTQRSVDFKINECRKQQEERLKAGR